MSSLAISARRLSKEYRIAQRHNTLRDLAVDRARSLIGRGGRGEAGESRVWALRDVSLEVARGERVGVIGRNGAGKSTLLKILARVTDPTSGRAEICGRVGSLLEVGTGFHPELTGRENVYLNGAVLGMRKREIDRRFDEIVEFAEVQKFLDMPVKRYSSGMNLRLAFAVAAHLEAEILIVDEVLAVGDISFQRKCLDKMSEVADSGRTILFVSHNMAAVQSICGRAVYLVQGEVAAAGPVDEVVATYLGSVGELHRHTLAQRRDRQGGESLRFDRVEFLDPETDAPLAVLISGQPVLIRIGLENVSSSVIPDIGIGIGFSTQNGAHLFACRNKAVGVGHDVPPGHWHADCVIPRWMLKGGRYHFYLYAEGRGVRLDEIREAGAVDVENGDYYGSGVLPAGHLPGVLVDFEWRRRLGAGTGGPARSPGATDPADGQPPARQGRTGI